MKRKLIKKQVGGSSGLMPMYMPSPSMDNEEKPRLKDRLKEKAKNIKEKVFKKSATKKSSSNKSMYKTGGSTRRK